MTPRVAAPHQPRPRPRREAPARRREPHGPRRTQRRTHRPERLRQVEPVRADPRRAPPGRRSVELPAAWTIAHVAQETPAVATPAIEFVLDGDRELREIERELAATEARPRSTPSARARRSRCCITASKRSAATQRAPARRRCCRASAFATRATAIPSRSFSGGWRMRLNLAQALMCRSDLLLLDEPTNHLDLDAVLWLEDWLARYPGTLLLVTHDRDFLDAVVDTIVAHRPAEAARPTPATTRSSSASGRMQLALQQATYAKQQRQIAHLQAFVDRFRAKATKAKQAQSRIKALERMERIAAAHVDSPFEFAFAPVSIAAQPARPARACHARLRRRAARSWSDLDWGILRRRSHRPSRPQRRRQVDAAQGDRRHLAPRAG